MDILNSPLILVGVFVAMILFGFYRKREFLKRKCEECGQRTMQEIAVQPNRLLENGGHTHSSSTGILATVKYQCTNCRAVSIESETRQ